MLMLEIVGFDQTHIFPNNYDFAVPRGVTPIVHDISTADKFAKFMEPSIVESRIPQLVGLGIRSAIGLLRAMLKIIDLRGCCAQSCKASYSGLQNKA